jgi:hypothetical protein
MHVGALFRQKTPGCIVMKISYLEGGIGGVVTAVARARRLRKPFTNAIDKIWHLFPDSYGETVESC